MGLSSRASPLTGTARRCGERTRQVRTWAALALDAIASLTVDQGNMDRGARLVAAAPTGG